MIKIEELKKSSRNHSQDLFTDFMKEIYGNRYQSTYAAGRIGDMKVDGVLDNTIAYAVYAPDTYHDNKAILKIKKDFEGFLTQREIGNWKNIKNLTFVIKVKHKGLSPKILNLLSEFNKDFTTEILTLDDLANLQKNALLLSIENDNKLLEELKSDTTNLIETLIDLDLSAQSLSFIILDNINLLENKWLNHKYYLFKNEQCENLKKEIFHELQAFVDCIVPKHFHVLQNGSFLRNDNSTDDIDFLYESLLPRIAEIQKNLKILLDKLWDIK